MTVPASYRPATRWSSAVRVFDLSLGQMLWSRRSVFMGIIVGSPVLLAVLIRVLLAAPSAQLRAGGAGLDGPSLFGILTWLLYVRFAVPAVGVFYGTALIADEVEDRTITYLFTRPIRRSAVLFGKYLAYLTCTLLLVLPATVVVYFVTIPLGGAGIARGFPVLLADLGALAAGVATYGAVFAFVGTWMRRPLVSGLVFAFGWEPAVLLLPGYLKRLTVAYYLQALVPHAIPYESPASILMRRSTDAPGVLASLVSLAAIAGVTLWLAGRTVERREYVLEQ